MFYLILSFVVAGAILIGLVLYGPRLFRYLRYEADAGAICHITLATGFLITLGLIAFWPAPTTSEFGRESGYEIAAIQRLSLIITVGLSCVCATLLWVGDMLRDAVGKKIAEDISA